MRRVLKYLLCTAAFLTMNACIEPIAFPDIEARDVIILDGMITDDDGPYTLKMFRGLRLDIDTASNVPVIGAQIILHSDKGEMESFTEINPGEYQTGGVIDGTVGTSYHITIQMPDGSTFESEPDELLPSGNVTNIKYQYEARKIVKPFGTQAADVFNIFIDADASVANGDASYVRWRFHGTYIVKTNPELHQTYLQGEFTFKTPYECSGYVVDPAIPGGVLRQQSPCTCCTCWVKQYESSPRLSDTDVVEGGQFSNVKVAEVPITRATFFEKYQVTIEQMSITKTAFDFFKVIRTQKDGASNLFQPPPGKLTGNIKPVDANYKIVGLFWAASIHRKSIYIHESELPYQLPVDIIPLMCTDVYTNSTTTKPEDWDD